MAMKRHLRACCSSYFTKKPLNETSSVEFRFGHQNLKDSGADLSYLTPMLYRLCMILI